MVIYYCSRRKVIKGPKQFPFVSFCCFMTLSLHSCFIYFIFLLRSSVALNLGSNFFLPFRLFSPRYSSWFGFCMFFCSVFVSVFSTFWWLNWAAHSRYLFWYDIPSVNSFSFPPYFGHLCLLRMWLLFLFQSSVAWRVWHRGKIEKSPGQCSSFWTTCPPPGRVCITLLWASFSSFNFVR